MQRVYEHDCCGGEGGDASKGDHGCEVREMNLAGGNYQASDHGG